MIFLDSNIPMYLIGGTHGHKIDAQRLLERAIADRAKLVTDAEVFQEILHRYTAINRRDAIQPAFDVLNGIVDVVFPITIDQVERAKTIVLGRPRLNARDAIHLATMERHGVNRIMTFDPDFDGVAGITRVA